MGLKLKNFEILSLRITTAVQWSCNGQEKSSSEASLKIRIGSEEPHIVAEDSGHNQAFFKALKKALDPFYPEVKGILLGTNEDTCIMGQIAAELDDAIELKCQECQ